MLVEEENNESRCLFLQIAADLQGNQMMEMRLKVSCKSRDEN